MKDLFRIKGQDSTIGTFPRESVATKGKYNLLLYRMGRFGGKTRRGRRAHDRDYKKTGRHSVCENERPAVDDGRSNPEFSRRTMLIL